MNQDTVHTATCPVSGCNEQFEAESAEAARNPGCGEPLPVEGVEPGYYNCSDCGHRVRVTA